MMNCIFCAEKLKIPIDACALSYDDKNAGLGRGVVNIQPGSESAKLETLTQAASITNGLYFELDAPRHDAFLQWLFTIFFAHSERRDLVRLLYEQSAELY